MKNCKTTNRKCNGSALLASAFALMVTAMVATGMTALLRQNSHMNTRLIHRTRALEVAEGGAKETLGTIFEAPEDAYFNDATFTKTVEDGEVVIDVVHIKDEEFCVQSTGTIKGVSQTIKVYTQVPSFSLALDKGIFSNSNIDGNGNGTLTNGSHSNQDTAYMGNCDVVGYVDASGTAETGGNATVDGGVRNDVPRLAFPRLDLKYYYDIAAENGQILNGDQDLKGTYSPPGGVLWIVGDANINSATTINGALFVTGSIRQTGNCVQNKVGDLPALVSRDGNIYLGGGGTFHGLIYANSGKVEITGTTDITGVIIAWGDVVTRGNWGVVQYELQNPELLDEHKLDVLAWER